MPSDKYDATQLLERSGLRRTPWRVKILSLLLKFPRPLSHEDIRRKLGPGADRVTVYRSLDAFVRVGLVHLVLADKRTRLYETSDRCTRHACHPHFTCRACGDTTCMVDVAVPRIRRKKVGYVFERQRVLIEGLCPACAGGAGL